ncbi:esterase family protein [Mycolicibacterium sp. PAM1]|uniref:Putative esterase n=1 Tax=Mycolicibacterium gilvum (strain PYR-GCK) TaxID=350054 RepID=A4T9U3_MYCGI|nr:alpha/beta hydrolase-fold protein [Mycolicibacterium sp. PAM1]ABP46019.1 putative esterase [Mycolicibacterium gilvum PYR-GCK]MBV5245871.1 esterase family protein [Mycolicibacterium sp. PAM1]
MTLPYLARHDLSLMHGWVPVSVQILAAAAMIAAVGWRTRRWRRVWVPWAASIGGGLAFTTYCYIRSAGVADESNPAPPTLWVWIALSGTAFGVLVAGWRGARRWRRTASALAVPLCALAAALVLNLWVGYFPTVDTAWNQLTAGPVPDQTDQVVVAALQKQHAVPIKGSVVPVQIPSTASGFTHRQEFVYVPPAWFASDPPPALPVVMMIGGEFNTPADWLRAGEAVKILDEFARAHRGYAPVAVFVDPGGTFDNDTECVNGPRGNAADHLVKDVVPYLKSQYGVSPAAAGWGVVGWSMGGTCAVDLTVMHPDIFSTFVDIAGDAAPNAGTRNETVQRLFGGDSAAYAAFDPTAVMERHGPYRGVEGWFAVNAVPGAATPNEQAVSAASLCGVGSRSGIACAVVSRPGNHDWPFASTAFATALPWLAARIGTPGVPQTGFPGTVHG